MGDDNQANAERVSGSDGSDGVDGSDVAEKEFDDAELLGQADWIIGGEQARKARQQGLYAAYLVFLGSLAYGFPLVQALFRTSNPEVLRQQLASPEALALLVAAIAAVFIAALWVGRFRGPVVPPLPWIDLVVTTPIDRALSVRRWWRFALSAGVFLGAITGLVLGGGLAFTGVTSPVSVAVGLVGGAAVAVAAAHLWLWSQVRSWPGPNRGPKLIWHVPEALRELHVDGLRAHSANTSTLAGSAMTGNLRTARLQLARPVRFARGVRLRAGRPFPTMVRRDILGLLRSPASLAAGFGLVVLGGAVVVWAATQGSAPGIGVTIGLVPLYLGFGAWSEGLRLQADNVGTPSLIGSGPLAEASAHLVVPLAFTTVVLVAGVVVSALATPVSALSLLSLLAVLAVLCGGHLLAAFRGSAPVRGGPQGMIAWYLMPVLFVLLVGSLMTFFVKAALWSWLGFAGWLTIGFVWWGFYQTRRLTHMHRA